MRKNIQQFKLNCSIKKNPPCNTINRCQGLFSYFSFFFLNSIFAISSLRLAWCMCVNVNKCLFTTSLCMRFPYSISPFSLFCVCMSFLFFVFIILVSALDMFCSFHFMCTRNIYALIQTGKKRVQLWKGECCCRLCNKYYDIHSMSSPNRRDTPRERARDWEWEETKNVPDNQNESDYFFCFFSSVPVNWIFTNEKWNCNEKKEMKKTEYWKWNKWNNVH